MASLKNLYQILILNSDIPKIIHERRRVPKTYDFRFPWLLYWQFLFSDPLKYDIFVSITVFVSEIRWNYAIFPFSAMKIGQFPTSAKEEPPFAFLKRLVKIFSNINSFCLLDKFHYFLFILEIPLQKKCICYSDTSFIKNEHTCTNGNDAPTHLT